jgi:UDP-2-acetamido-2,6-beta-L-arabino-hexul-4-ose reductase
MNIGVTGSKGFIGKNLVEKLKAKNHKVVEFAGDIKNIEDVKELYQSVSKVVHLAGKNRGNEEEIFLTNTLGISNVCECIKLYKTPTIVMGSNYTKPSAYLRSKHIADLLVKELKEVRVLNYKCPNVIGVGCKPFYNSFISTLCYLEAKKEPYIHLINNTEEIIVGVDVDLLTNDMILSLEDELRTFFFKNMFAGQRWFTEEEIIKISFAEIVEIFQNRKDSKNKYKTFILKIVESYKNYVKV